MTLFSRRGLFGAAVIAATFGLGLGSGANPAQAESVLRVNMHSDLKIVDPIWTTAYMLLILSLFS